MGQRFGEVGAEYDAPQSKKRGRRGTLKKHGSNDWRVKGK